MENAAGARQLRNFWKKVDKSPHPKGCWLWTAARHEKGYGWFGFRGKMDKAHRVSYIVNRGEIPAGLCVLHTCDNPPCMNPAHLWLGTNKANVDDRVAKGRSNRPIGERNGGGGKLTRKKARDIRALAKLGFSQQERADRFGVSQKLISKIDRGELWRE